MQVRYLQANFYPVCGQILKRENPHPNRNVLRFPQIIYIVYDVTLKNTSPREAVLSMTTRGYVR